MSLMPQLFDRSFNDFVEIGLAKLRSLAPTWTDYNAHDPGITLLELLAWNAEAQMYALSRMRRDEREAYAALFGLKSEGTRAAEGMIWSTRQAQGSFHSDLTNTFLDVDASIGLEGSDQPNFHPRDRLLLIAGSITGVRSRRLGITPIKEARFDRIGSHLESQTSLRHEMTFPSNLFGNGSGSDHVVEIDIDCRDPNGLLGNDPDRNRTARLALGFMVPAIRKGSPTKTLFNAELVLWNSIRPEIIATIISQDRRFALPVTWDSSFGLMQSGAMLLDLSQIDSSPNRFTIELRAPRGFPRPPRVSSMDVNVVPIVQGRSIFREMHDAFDLPNWEIALQETQDSSGLQFDQDDPPVLIEVEENGRLTPWACVEQLSESEPKDCVYECDDSAGRVTFGNGINGKLPRNESFVYASYRVCDGDSGNVSRNRKWKVPGFQGTFGRNPLPIAGGQDAQPAFSKRREARQQARTIETLVTDEDIVSATLELPFLDVSRAWIAAPHPESPIANLVKLVAICEVGSTVSSEQLTANAKWLHSVRRCLAPRMPLGTRLEVTSPVLTPLSLRAQIEVESGTKPQLVRESVLNTLRSHFAVTQQDQGPGAKLLEPGSLVTLHDIAILIRTTAGVQGLGKLELFDRDGNLVPSGKMGEPPMIHASANSLLLWLEHQSEIVARSTSELQDAHVYCRASSPSTLADSASQATNGDRHAF